LPIQQHGFDESTPPDGWRAGSLAHIFFESTLEGFSLIQKINVEINIFVLALC
jgi:hypothetical protein